MEVVVNSNELYSNGRRAHNLKVIGSNPIPATTFVITHSPSRFNRRDGLSFSGERWNGFSYGRRDRVRRMQENANRNSYAACNPSLSASDISVQPGHT